jgi:osmotically inducible protein OsmC
MAASHAACYAMALNATLGRKNASAARTVVSAEIVADKGDAGIKVTTSRLKVVAEGVQGLDNAGFEQAAKEAESKCPISNALRGNLVIELDVQVK